MAIAIVGGIVGRWSHNRPAVPAATAILKIMFAVVVIAMLDQGRTQTVARGFAWLFLAGVLLSNNSPLTGIAKSINAKPKPAAKPKPKGKK
jgi:uncharacterized membrane protein YbjE (DUF340 family)